MLKQTRLRIDNMNFDDTLQEAAFRAEAKVWIAANAPKQYEEELKKASLGRTQLKGANILEVAKAWQKKKAEAGWACLHWPKEYGGRGASPIERVIWQQEEGAFGKLSAMFIIGHGMCGPTMMAYAGEDQKRKYLPPLASGEKIWCQLFSEPAGGSDVAGLRTRAERKGDDWIVNGQKIWTSGAHYSDYDMVAGSMVQDVAAYALDLQGAAGVLSGPEDAEAAGKFQAMLLRAPGTRVEGGTDEIMRNIIAERVLGLPGDIRVDKEVPFNEIPTGGRG